MTESFDEYKDSYREAVQQSISFAGQDVDFFSEVKAEHLVELVRRQLGDPAELTALDVGCGVGLTDSFVRRVFGDLHGVDVSAGVVERAAEVNPDVTYRVYDGETLPYEEDTFHVSFAICVLHHVPPADWERFVGEMARVTRPGGLLVIFEHNPLNPLTLLAVNRCEFDEDAVLLRKGKTRRLLERRNLLFTDARYILFFPWRRRIFRRIERYLTGLPLGAQYMIAGRKPATALVSTPEASHPRLGLAQPQPVRQAD